MAFTLIPVSLADARDFLRKHHRHHPTVAGHLFSLGCLRDGNLVGVAVIGRPVARRRDDGTTAEVTRLCTDGTRNACSYLYSAAARAVFQRGYVRIGTYILETETGVSLRAANWVCRYRTRGGSWNRRGRPRNTQNMGRKWLYERVAPGFSSIQTISRFPHNPTSRP